GVYLGSSDLDAPDLVSIGDGSILSEGCLLATTSVERGLFRVGEVRIGQRAFIGGQAVVGRGCRVGDGAVLEDLSALPAGETMPDGEV
uniref:DapH/DapD/GlmU-related protein n=4 Tax=Pseudomonadota TaxID=1224 RepID=UPI0013D894FA